MNKKQQEQARRDVILTSPQYVRIGVGHAHYRTIVDAVWRAWDRTGHGGCPSGEVPTAFLVTDQRGTARMLWYVGVDGTWRDASWRAPADRSTHRWLRDACRQAVQGDVDTFRGSWSPRDYHVDHAEEPFVELMRSWHGSLPGEAQAEVFDHIASPPGVAFEIACARGRSGAGGATGQREFASTRKGCEYRASWIAYHNHHATLQVLPAKENMRLGARPHGVDAAAAREGESLDDFLRRVL
jgi:hypothetical protein